MKQHQSDLVSLTFGIFFLCVIVFWVLRVVADMSLPQPGWTLAAALIFFGVLGLVKTWRNGRNDSKAEEN